MIKIRKNAFETNSSSTHALIIKNTDVTLTDDCWINPNAIISVFDDNDYKIDFYNDTLTEPIDKLRYLYTCLCQANLYWYQDNSVEINCNSDAYQVFSWIKELFSKINFIIPKQYTYTFEDCEWVISDLYDKYENKPDEFKNFLILFLNFGTVVFCDRDEDYELSDALHEEVKENSLYSLVTGG